SIIFPSGDKAIALTPERPGTISSGPSVGISCCSRFRKYILENAPRYSSRPKRQCLAKNFQVPPKENASAVSFMLKSVLPYPSLLKTNTALGPHSTDPSTILVKCTPRNGN